MSNVVEISRCVVQATYTNTLHEETKLHHRNTASRNNLTIQYNLQGKQQKR